MVIEIDGNRFALPFRTSIRHNYCFKFRNSGRRTEAQTGIDFTKAVVITDEKYIGEKATIDNEEFAELKKRFYFVIAKFRRYLADFLRYCDEGGDELATRRFRFTTLKYFENALLCTKKKEKLTGETPSSRAAD